MLTATDAVGTGDAFISEDFVLGNDPARVLYFDYVQTLPIVDYHNHLPPDELAADKRYDTLTRIWLNGDHYKWRAMRANGVPEDLITGDADDWTKFRAWAATVPYTMRNPLYHWTHMELCKPFGISELLNEASARRIYDACNEQLQTRWSARSLLGAYDVQVVCTTDDPTDDLRFHEQMRREGGPLTMLPTFRPDALLPSMGNGQWRANVDRLGSMANVAITDLDSFLSALASRVDAFHALGCRASDHGLLQMPPAAERTGAIDQAFRQLLAGGSPDTSVVAQLQGYVLLQLCRLYHQRGWVQQFHLGALRNASTRLMRRLGPNVGGDSISDVPQAHRLADFLDALDRDDQLAKTILYNLNPADNEVFATIIGNFQAGDSQSGTVPGKLQWGSGWWFLDQKDGMETQLNALSNMGLLSRFVGMVTDSRSFLSFSRHDYFRRILCNLIGQDIQQGLLPNDVPWLGQMAANISYHNAVNYFGWTI